MAIHRFFQERDFFQVHTPIITTSDCEGAGEMFTVTALGPDQLGIKDPFNNDFFGQQAGLTVSGQLKAEAKDYDKAIACLRQIPSSDPNVPGATGMFPTQPPVARNITAFSRNCMARVYNLNGFLSSCKIRA